MKKLIMIPVESSNLARIGHDGTDLFVEFKNGSHYAYEGVPATAFVAMLNAESAGKFLNQKIKPNYAYQKLEQQVA